MKGGRWLTLSEGGSVSGGMMVVEGDDKVTLIKFWETKGDDS